MITNLTSPIGLALLLLAAAFVLLHWRYHPRSTPIDSFDALKARQGRGKPLLLQFHAPL